MVQPQAWTQSSTHATCTLTCMLCSDVAPLTSGWWQALICFLHVLHLTIPIGIKHTGKYRWQITLHISAPNLRYHSHVLIFVLFHVSVSLKSLKSVMFLLIQQSTDVGAFQAPWQFHRGVVCTTPILGLCEQFHKHVHV